MCVKKPRLLKNSPEKGSVGLAGAEVLLSSGLSPELCWCVQLQDSRGLEPSVQFSPCRHSDGHHSSYLLKAVAQLRCQLRACLPRVPPAPSRSPSAWRWVGGALLGPVVLSKCPRLYRVALCEAEKARPACSKPYVVESRFNWRLFWQFLHPHLLVLGTAIVVRSPPAPPKPGTRKDLARSLQKPQPERRRDSLTSLKGDFRQQQGLAWGPGPRDPRRT